jgi:hypothetical protein
MKRCIQMSSRNARGAVDTGFMPNNVDTPRPDRQAEALRWLRRRTA